MECSCAVIKSSQIIYVFSTLHVKLNKRKKKLIRRRMKNFFFLSFNSIFSWAQRCLYSFFCVEKGRGCVNTFYLKKEVSCTQTHVISHIVVAYLLFYLFQSISIIFIATDKYFSYRTLIKKYIRSIKIYFEENIRDKASYA